MKVFALGGYGKVGFPAIKLLAQSDLIGEKAIAVHADGTDEQKLTLLLAGYDIIMNSATDETVLPTIRAAIRTGTDYCDANVVIEQALQLASEAEAVGVISIVANGVAPCISNLMGVHVARQLEEVEQLQVGLAWILDFQSGRELTPRQWLEEPRQSLTALHGFRPFIAMVLRIAQKNGMRTVYVYHDGRWGETDPVSNGLDVPLTQNNNKAPIDISTAHLAILYVAKAVY